MFARPARDYGETPIAETPFQKAGQVWDERIGGPIVQAANWRIMAFACLGMAVVATTALIWKSMSSSVTPYVVEVDELGGVQAVGPANASYNPTDAQIAHHLAKLLENVRGLSVDPIVVRQNWFEAYAFTTDKGAIVLNDYARENDPFADVGRKSRTVDVVSVVRVSDDSYQARWIERTYERSSLTQIERFTGLMTIVIKPPTDAETLRQNPLGIFVHGLNWGQDLDMTGETP